MIEPTAPPLTASPARSIRGRRRAPAAASIGITVVAALTLLAAACGSSTSSSTGTTGAGAASATTTNAASSCPFSGQTTPSSGRAQTAVATSLTKVSTRKDNCIDNVQFDFSPGVPAWSVSYQPGPFTSKSGQAAPPAASAYLVVEFQGVSASDAGSSSISAAGLNYVKQVTEVAGPTGSDEWVISLDQQVQYTTSVSGTPAYFVLGLG